MSPTTADGGFIHEAFFYGDDDEYVAGTVPFIEAGLGSGQPVLVAVPPSRIDLVRDNLGVAADPLLRLVSMEQMGHNPAWIIPAWHDFVAPHLAAGRTARGIGEPIWQERSADELEECARHEALINLAFAEASGFTLLCPYDTARLAPAVIDGAMRNHPRISRGGTSAASSGYTGAIPERLETPLPPVPDDAVTLDFDLASLGSVRRLAAAAAARAGLPRHRIDALLLAVSEIATNSVRHAGGVGQALVWSEPGRLICEVRDGGHIDDPLAGRVRPQVDEPGGRGMWLTHQVCDLVQIRGRDDGQAIRLHISS